jgi:hypothetical protein
MRPRGKRQANEPRMPLETVLGAVQMLQRLGVSNDEISDALLAGLAVVHNPSLKLADKPERI